MTEQLDMECADMVGAGLPSGWVLVRPDDVSAPERYSLGIGPFGSNLRVPDYRSEGVPLVFVRNIRAAEFGCGDDKYVTPEKAAELRAHEVKPGDVLITKMGDPPGDSCVYPASRPKGIITADCVRWRIDPAVGIPEFFALATRSLPVRQQILQKTKGVAQKKISLGRFRKVQYPLAPLPEQRRIVAEIEKQFTRLDAAVADLERSKRNVERARSSVLKAAVDGRLVPTEAELARKEGRSFETAEQAIARVEQPPRPNRWKTRAKEVIEGHAALAVCNPGTDVPEGWTWAQLADIAAMASGHTPSRRHPEWWDGDIPWVGIQDARDAHGGVIRDTSQHTNEDGLANSASVLLPAGTVCLSRTASVGYVVVMGQDMATSQDFVNWTPTQAITARWLQTVLMADKNALLGFGKGSVHTTIYFPQVLSFHVAVPPVAEQERIVAEVERQFSVLDVLEATIEKNLRRCEALRQSILKRAFEGKLVPQDPNDEPASELLARIGSGGSDV